jgi:hypothetical protein
MDTNGVQPFRSATRCALANCQANMLLAPMYRALPALTTSCRASMVSSIGVP